MLAVQGGEHRGHLRAEDARPAAARRHLEDGDLGARVARRGGDLETDPAAADDHDARAVARTVAQAVGVVEGAQGERRVGARDGEAARARPGGEQQLVVAERVPSASVDLVRARVDRDDRGMPRAQVDVVLGVPVVGMHERLVEFGLALQVVLGQRRPLVGQVGLGAEERDAAGEALVAQRLDGLGAGQAGSDDDERFGVSAMVLPPSIGVAAQVLP